MKKVILILASSFLFGGCGLSVIQKQKLLTTLDQSKAQVDQARNSACATTCGQDLTDKLNGIYSLIEAAIENYK